MDSALRASVLFVNPKGLNSNHFIADLQKINALSGILLLVIASPSKFL